MTSARWLSIICFFCCFVPLLISLFIEPMSQQRVVGFGILTIVTGLIMLVTWEESTPRKDR